jgi:hypothetical protein
MSNRRTPSPTLLRLRGKAACGRALLILMLLVGSAASAGAAIQTLGPPQLLPLPAITPPPTPAPLAPPINPGYASAPADGLSPILHESVPLFESPQPQPPSYPQMQLPGPIDQQKMQAYANSLRAQQWQLQSQGLSPSSLISRQIIQQLNTPDAQ